MSAVTVQQARDVVGSVWRRVPSPLSTALVGAVAVAVVAGGSVAVTTAVLLDRVEAVAERAETAERELAVVRSEQVAGERSAGRRTRAVLDELAALRAQVAQLQAESAAAG